MLNGKLILSQLEIFLFGFQPQEKAERKPLVELSFGRAAPSPAGLLHWVEKENDLGGGIQLTLTSCSPAFGICRCKVRGAAGESDATS